MVLVALWKTTCLVLHGTRETIAGRGLMWERFVEVAVDTDGGCAALSPTNVP